MSGLGLSDAERKEALKSVPAAGATPAQVATAIGGEVAKVANAAIAAGKATPDDVRKALSACVGTGACDDVKTAFDAYHAAKK